MAQGDTKNVGTIAALWVAATAPTNTKLIWYDTANSTHRTYNTSTGQWDALTPQSVTNITLSALTTAAQSGLPIGKFYYLTDIGTLAVAITQTKIWYVDVHSNYVVNDLVASIQSYVNSTNLLIDGVTGVWDAENGRLLFNFTEQTTPAFLNKDKDYILMHRNNSGVMSWVKTKLANLISNVSGNSISWNNGLFFSANSYVGSIKDKSGGVVGYDSYLIQIASIEAEIDNLAADNNAVRQDAYNYTDGKVTPTEIYGKQLPSAITPSGSPSQPIVGWSLKSILNDIYGWVNKFKYGNNISIGANFNTNGVPGDVNQSDNITNAFQKIVYKLKQLLVTNGIKLPSNYVKDSGDGHVIKPEPNDNLTAAIGKLHKMIEAWSADMNDNLVWDADFRDEDWYANVSVGDEIGKFDSHGNPLYTASLEGAVYLLSAWYRERMKLRIASTAHAAYYTSGKGDGRQEHNVSISVKCVESCVRFEMTDRLRFDTYQESTDLLLSSKSDDDACLIIRDIPNDITNRIGNTYGRNSPIPTGIPISAEVGYDGAAVGTLVAVLVQPNQGSAVDAYFKLFPYFTHGMKKGSSVMCKTYIDAGQPLVSDGTWSDYVSNVFKNNDCAFGSGWLSVAGLSEEMYTIHIPKFSFALPC